MAEKVKKDVGFVSMIIHCCGMPSPHSLVAPRDIRATMDRSVMSHFWVSGVELYHFISMKKNIPDYLCFSDLASIFTSHA